MPQSIIPFLAPIFGKVGATIAANLLVSVALSALSTALMRQKGADQSRELSIPNSQPPHRFAYGKRVRLQGSPAPGWVVQDGVLYQCIILNSRPSAGTDLKIFIDKREITLSGDVSDFGQVQQGRVTIAQGNTTVVVSHGLSGTPGASERGASYDGGAVSVTEVGASTMRLTLSAPAPAGGASVYWSAWLPGGAGAEASSAPFSGHFRCWLGLGDQGHPPAQILSEIGDGAAIDQRKFWASDKWTNSTVLWVRCVAGNANSRQERWPSAPPEIEVEMDWSLVWDPRDLTQDADDPSTWTVSDNQALCLLDALRFNPLARYPMSALWLETFQHAADVADQVVGIRGGTEPRYRVGGMLVFNGSNELLDQLQPLAQAGGGTLIKVGGRVGYRAGEYQAPVVTLTDYLRGPMRFQSTRRDRELPNAVKAVFPDPASQWEAGELIPYRVRDDWDGGPDRVEVLDMPMVPFPRQAMRLQKIAAERLKAGKTFAATFPPDAIKLVAGSPVAIGLPSPDRRNGGYQVARMHPAQFLESDEGVALAMTMDLTEDGPQIYAWTADEEQDRIGPGFESIDLSLSPPTLFEFSVSGSNVPFSFRAPGSVQWVTIGAGIDQYQEQQFVLSPGVTRFDWEYRVNQGGWLSGGSIAINTIISDIASPNVGRAPGQLSGVSSVNSYDIRVQSIGDGRASAYLYSLPVQVGFTLTAPTGVSASGGAGQITINATSPNDTAHHALQYWGANVNNAAAAVLLSEQVVAQNTANSFTETGLGASVTRFYFVRSVTSAGAVGPFAPVVSATTNA